MIIAPCSMKTVAGISSGYADNLLLRAADVCIKEGRKIIVVPREIPLSRIHLRNSKEIAETLETIIGKENTQLFYFNANLNGLVEYLKKYAPEDEIYKFINKFLSCRLHLQRA